MESVNKYSDRRLHFPQSTRIDSRISCQNTSRRTHRVKSQGDTREKKMTVSSHVRVAVFEKVTVK